MLIAVVLLGVVLSLIAIAAGVPVSESDEDYEGAIADEALGWYD